MESENRIVEHLIDQFNRSWGMLLQAIENVPDENWTDSIERIDTAWSETKGMNVWYFSNVVYHIIQSVDFYANDTPDDFKWGGRIGGIDWKTESPDVTASRVTKQDMLQYLNDIKDKLNKKLRSLSESDFFEQDGFKEWQASRLAKYIYTLRHSMWHIGELGRAMRNYDCKRTNWQ